MISLEEKTQLLKLPFLTNLEFQNLNLELFLNQEITKVLSRELYQALQDLEVKKHNQEMKAILQHLEILIMVEAEDLVVLAVAASVVVEDLAVVAEEAKN